MESASIVLPEPVSPMTASRSPEESEKETLCKSTRSPRESFAEIVPQAYENAGESSDAAIGVPS